MSRCLDTQSYMEYSEARQMSFCMYLVKVIGHLKKKILSKSAALRNFSDNFVGLPIILSTSVSQNRVIFTPFLDFAKRKVLYRRVSIYVCICQCGPVFAHLRFCSESQKMKDRA